MSEGGNGERRKVVVTGVAGRLGRLVAKRLHREGGYRIVGLDRRPFSGLPKDMEYAQVDLRSKKARDVFRSGDVAALVHLGILHDPRQTPDEHQQWNVVATGKLFEYCQSYGVPKVVVLSSANVYGPRPENPQFLGEESPLLAAQDFPEIRDLIELDMVAGSFFWRAREVETVILRPVHILGSVHNAASNYLRLPIVPTLLGFDPMVQVIHEEDVAEAIVCALRPGVRGIYNVVGPGEVPLSVLLRELGKPVLRVPHVVARPLMTALWRMKLTSYPVPELAHIRYVCMVDGRRARAELGFAPRRTLRETIRAAAELE
ncbi:MAG: SDR family oxidoreductase [Myxococcota bacterium]